MYVASLQRRTHSPRSLDMKRLNRVIRWAHRNPHGLTYRALPKPRILIAVGDSSFQTPSAEELSTGKIPLVMRGFIICWAHCIEKKVSNNDVEKTNVMKLPGVSIANRSYKLQILESCAGKQAHVCRGVWSAELHNQCDMIGMATIMTGFSFEVQYGAQSGSVIMKKLEAGEVSMPLDTFTDSYSIFSYLAAQHLKYPAEKRNLFPFDIFAREHVGRINSFIQLDRYKRYVL